MSTRSDSGVFAVGEAEEVDLVVEDVGDEPVGGVLESERQLGCVLAGAAEGDSEGAVRPGRNVG